MKTVSVWLTLSLIAFGSCKGKKIKSENETTHLKQPEMAVQEPNAQDPHFAYTRHYSFYSIGSGADWENAAALYNFLLAHPMQSRIVVERIPWGREGEVDICLYLKQMPPEEVHRILHTCDSIAKASPFCHIKVQAPCLRKFDR